MPPKILIEICAGSIESAIAAAKGGADRIELCCALAEGGLTPSHAMIEYVTANLTIRTFVLIRPRAGDFSYSRAEFEVMKSDIFSAKARGAGGIVTGMLNTDGSIDTCRMKEIVEMANPMQVTFNRAFDLAKDPYEALEVIIALGCNRILTSGMARTAFEGAELISGLVKQAGTRIVIMPGSGVNASNLRELHSATGAREFHLSATSATKSKMAFRKQGVNMGNESSDEYNFLQTDKELVSEICSLASGLTI
ncbi:MAG: copper homeostasis protein CutC [Bacteroidota bacterium]